MELDSTLIEYMKKKAEFARIASCVIAVQCLALAVFFCAYGLLQNYFVYSKTLDIARKIVMTIAIVVTLVLQVINTLVCIKYKEVNKLRPDGIALRQSIDTVREAYIIARPYLIYRITISILIAVTSGLLYILLMIILDRSVMAGVYGRILVTIFIAISIYIGLPSVSRIGDYRALLGETHRLSHDYKENYIFYHALALTVPGSITAWYLLRFYTDRYEIAWIVFPMVILFGLSVVYLINFCKATKNV